MPTVVVNKHVARGEVYVGRARGNEHFGNPFSHLPSSHRVVRVRTRAEAVARCATWLDGTTDQDVEPERRLWVLANLHRLRGRRIECFCAPLPCHGDVLAALADGRPYGGVGT